MLLSLSIPDEKNSARRPGGGNSETIAGRRTNYTEIVDAVHSREAEQRYVTKLRAARDSIFNLVRETQPHGTEAKLPIDYQRVYRTLTSSLLGLEKTLNNRTNAAVERIQAHRNLPDTFSSARISPARLAAIKKALQAINTAEETLYKAFDKANWAVSELQAPHPINWRAAFDQASFKVSLYLDPGPFLAFYDASFHDDEIPAVTIENFCLYMNLPDDPSCNWNVFAQSEGHPLKTDHHGYLVHSILTQTPIPWQIAHRIREIKVEMEVRDQITVWKRPSRTALKPQGSDES